MKQNYIPIGKIFAAHGIKGAVKIKILTESLTTFKTLLPCYNKDGDTQYKLSILSTPKEDLIIAKLEGSNNRNEAESLKNTTLYAASDLLPKLPEDEFYYSDLIGITTKLENGEAYGKIIQIDDFGAGPVITILEKQSKKEAMYPFTRAIFPTLDLKTQNAIICPPDTTIASKEHD